MGAPSFASVNETMPIVAKNDESGKVAEKGAEGFTPIVTCTLSACGGWSPMIPNMLGPPFASPRLFYH